MVHFGRWSASPVGLMFKTLETSVFVFKSIVVGVFSPISKKSKLAIDEWSLQVAELTTTN